MRKRTVLWSLSGVSSPSAPETHILVSSSNEMGFAEPTVLSLELHRDFIKLSKVHFKFWNSLSSISFQKSLDFSKWNWRQMTMSYRVLPSYSPPSLRLISAMKKDKTFPKWFLFTLRGLFRLQNMISCGQVGMHNRFCLQLLKSARAHCTFHSIITAKVLLLSCSMMSSEVGGWNLDSWGASPPPVQISSGMTSTGAGAELVEAGCKDGRVSSRRSGKAKGGALQFCVEVPTALQESNMLKEMCFR